MKVEKSKGSEKIRGVYVMAEYIYDIVCLMGVFCILSLAFLGFFNASLSLSTFIESPILESGLMLKLSSTIILNIMYLYLIMIIIFTLMGLKEREEFYFENENKNADVLINNKDILIKQIKHQEKFLSIFKLPYWLLNLGFIMILIILSICMFFTLNKVASIGFFAEYKESYQSFHALLIGGISFFAIIVSKSLKSKMKTYTKLQKIKVNFTKDGIKTVSTSKTTKIIKLIEEDYQYDLNSMKRKFYIFDKVN